MIPTLELPSGEAVPVLGQGTWKMGERPERRQSELATLQEGLDLGLTLIDTAEMYGDGLAEELMREALIGRRDQAFIVSKVYPHNATRKGTIEACERSLQRLGTDRIDLYLLHWRSGNDIKQAIEGFSRLVEDGKIRYFGVSNFDRNDLDEWASIPGGDALAANQILYNLGRRWSEWDTLDWCRDHNVPVMAYTPLEPAVGPVASVFDDIAARHNASAAQIALAWLLAQPGVISIPKASSVDHVRENAAAVEIKLTDEDVTELNQSFPAPDSPVPMELI